MKRALTVALFAACVLAQSLLAQAPPPMPKPGPEHKRLDYFVGHWKGTGTAKQSPFGPAGKITFDEQIEWFPGGFFQVARAEAVVHTEEQGPVGGMKMLGIMGYSSEEKAYTFHVIDSLGETVSARMTVEGDTWTMMRESKMGGKPIKRRMTIKEVPPASLSMKLELSQDGGPWATIMEAELSKAP